MTAQTGVPALVGVILLGDQVRPGWGAAVVVGLVLAVAGTVLLSGEQQTRRGAAGPEHVTCCGQDLSATGGRLDAWHHDPLLILSGAGLPASAWDEVRSRLDAESRVVPSPGPSGTLGSYAEAALAAAEDWPRFHLVAHSLGGAVASARGGRRTRAACRG